MRNRKRVFFLLILSLSVAVFLSCQAWNEKVKNEKKRQVGWLALKETLLEKISESNLEAGIVIKDLSTGQDISFNDEELFPSASLAKVPIMVASFQASSEGRFKLTRRIALKSSDKLGGSGVLKSMPAGTVLSVERLIGMMIYDSDNTATNIVTNLVGLDYLNSAFESFGLKNTRLDRKIADYRARKRGIENYTTAKDISLLLEKIYFGALGSKDISAHCINLMKLCRMNDRIPKYLPAELAIAHKTGLERHVCHDAGIVFTCKGDFIITVLTKHNNSNSSLAKEFIARVAALVYKFFEQF